MMTTAGLTVGAMKVVAGALPTFPVEAALPRAQVVLPMIKTQALSLMLLQAMAPQGAAAAAWRPLGGKVETPQLAAVLGKHVV